ncbi:MAG TPA: hypothetical protein VF501_01760, partial [Thiobacillus sp.]
LRRTSACSATASGRILGRHAIFGYTTLVVGYDQLFDKYRIYFKKSGVSHELSGPSRRKSANSPLMGFNQSKWI